MQYLDQTSLREMSIFRPSKVRSHRQVHECSSTMENVLSVLALLHIKYFKPSIMKRKMTGFFSSMWYPWKTYTYNDKYNIFSGISRKDTSGRKTPEPVFRNPRVGALFIKWRTVWLMAMDRHRKLRDALDYLEEVNN